MEPFDDDDFGQLYATDIELPNVISFQEEEEEEEEAAAAEDDCVASDDSDDDGLKIVLNDDDCPVGVFRCDDDSDGNECDNSGTRCFRPNKCVRSRGSSTFVSNVKSLGMASYISSLNKNRSSVDSGIQNLGSSSAQCGYGSFLPWYWGIFDVNIDHLMEKPWKVPGVDITDYFNFGFNESTWKLYCASLDQLWQTSLQTSISVYDSAKLNKEGMGELADQVVSGNVLFPSSNCELPKGRAIQVEDSIVERQPSIDIRRPRNRDSNIIEIKLLESPDDHSGSGHSTVMDASAEGESMAGNSRSIHTSSSEQGEVLSEVQLDEVKKSDNSSVLRRCSSIPGVDGDEHNDQADQHSEDTAGVLEGKEKVEEDDVIGSSYPCWIESELSLGDQEHSLTSYTDSDSEAKENSVHVDNERSPSPLRRKTLNSVVKVKESTPLYCKNSKNNSFDRKTVNVVYNSRPRGSFRKEWRQQSRRNVIAYNMNKHIVNGDDIPSIVKSSARDLSLFSHKYADCDRHKELHIFDSHKRRDVLCNRETKQSYYYDGEKVVDDLVRQHSKCYQEDQRSFRESPNRYGRKREADYYFLKPGPQITDSEDRERDWCHPAWDSADDPSPHSYRESRRPFPKHSSFPDMEREMDDMSHFKDRNCMNDFDEWEFEFLNKSYRMSTSANGGMESLHDKDEEQFIDRDWRRSVQRERDNLCFGTVEDDCQRYTHYQTSIFKYRSRRQRYSDSARNYAYDANEEFGGCGRHKHAGDSRRNNWSSGYGDAAEDEDVNFYPVEEYQFYRPPSKFRNCTEDEIFCRLHKTHAKSLQQIDDIKLHQHQLSMPKRYSGKYSKSNSKIICRSMGGQAALRCKKTVDLINGEGKSHVKSSRVLLNGESECLDQGIAKKQRASMGFDESNKMASRFNTSKFESSHESKICLQSHPDQRRDESSDIEEGQIIAEEPYTQVSVSRRDVSEDAARTYSVKKSMSQKENSSKQFTGGIGSQRILDSLAKMEKRRERFKQSITVKKEAEETLKLNNVSVVDSGEMKQQRPARKRRWVGN